MWIIGAGMATRIVSKEDRALTIEVGTRRRQRGTMINNDSKRPALPPCLNELRACQSGQRRKRCAVLAIGMGLAEARHKEHNCHNCQACIFSPRSHGKSVGAEPPASLDCEVIGHIIWIRGPWLCCLPSSSWRVYLWHWKCTLMVRKEQELTFLQMVRLKALQMTGVCIYRSLIEFA